jgi:hypothetical protein
MITELEEVLQHHGVKGMKWGKRKSEKSAEVTKAEGAVAERKKEYKQISRQHLKESSLGTASLATTREKSARKNELKYAKEDLASTKILEKVNSKPKSNAQLKAEVRYRKKGLSADEATVAAYRNIQFKRIAATAAVTTIAVGGAYAGYKIRDARVDKIIKSGTKLQQVSSDSTMGVRDAFYSANNKLDKSKYKGLYGKVLKDQDGAAFTKDIKVLKDIKQASPNNARKTLEELFQKDPVFAEDVKNYMQYENVHKKLGANFSEKALRSRRILNQGKINKDTYDIFNTALVDHTPEMQSITDRYFKALSDKGYNAIRDVNDSKYSGFKSLNPIISFGTKGKVDVVNVRELTQKEINKHSNISYTHMLGTDLVKEGAATTGVILGANKGIKSIKSKVNRRTADKYRKEHPNTKLTNTEIVRMLERRSLDGA